MNDGVAAAARRICEAAITLLPEWMAFDFDADRDDVGYLELRDRVLGAIAAAAEGVDPFERLKVIASLQSMIAVGIGLGADENRAVADAERVIRDAHIDQLQERYDSGDEAWPPGRDAGWDEVRVAVGRFMDDRAGDWPRIAFVDRPGILVHTPFQAAVVGAQSFLGMWLRQDRAELVEQLGSEIVAAWEEFLELTTP